MNYNIKKIDKGAVRFVFVTRGRAKPFSDSEIEDFFSDKAEIISTPFRIPDNRARKIMFLKDLKMGVAFCMNKYNATQEQIISEANRVAPYHSSGEK